MQSHAGSMAAVDKGGSVPAATLRARLKSAAWHAEPRHPNPVQSMQVA